MVATISPPAQLVFAGVKRFGSGLNGGDWGLLRLELNGNPLHRERRQLDRPHGHRVIEMQLDPLETAIDNGTIGRD